jgi:ATPase subunit of ABC transporter with duplicated ATPase domains
MLAAVIVSGVTFELPNGRLLFDNLNFSLNNKVTGLVGPNGVGKTCIAKLIAGLHEPTHGSIKKNSSVTYLTQREVPPEISVQEYLEPDYSWPVLGERLLSGIARESLCTTLSGGQWMRVRLANTLNDQFLILDEPTNDLDREGREMLLQFLRQREGGILLISHDREALSLCAEILELSNKGLSKFSGDFTNYTDAKSNERNNLQRELELAERSRHQAHSERIENIERQEKRNRAGVIAAARGGIPKILLGARKRKAQVSTGKIDKDTYNRANAAVNAAHEALSELKVDPVMYADLIGQKIPAQKLVAEAFNFNVFFNDWLYKKDLNFSWRGNIRVALKGGNGSGKSTLIKALRGHEYKTRGELRTGNLRTLYIDQRCETLDETKTVFENIRDVSSLSESEIRSGLAKFLFVHDDVFKKVSYLSGGERLRAALALGLLQIDKPELLILDEPTNNLDLQNIEFLENLMREFKSALIVISHDEIFLENCGIDMTLLT